MGAEEVSAYLEAASSDLETARILLENKRHADAVLHSALALEKAAAALILHLGAKPSRRHRNSAILYRIVPSNVQRTVRFVRLLESLKKLEPKMVEARYPVPVGGKLVPPTERFVEADASSAYTAAQAGFSLVRNWLRRGLLRSE